MKKGSSVSFTRREVYVPISGDEEKKYAVTGSYSWSTDKYGEDADGNRGEMRIFVDLKIDKITEIDEDGNEIDCGDLPKDIEDYIENYLVDDVELEDSYE
jgi:hypothetical protein